MSEAELTLPAIANEPISLVLMGRDPSVPLEDILTAWTTELDSLSREYEILLVDNTADESLGQAFPRLQVLRMSEPAGLGTAHRVGIAAAKFPLVCTAPCDQQYQPADLALLMKPIDRCHLVSGFRVRRRVPLPLRVLGWFWRVLLRIGFDLRLEPLPGWLGWRGHAWRAFVGRVIFGLRIRDVACPFRLYRRSIFERIPIQSESDFVLLEILAKANFLGCIMADVPVTQTGPDQMWTREERTQVWKDFRRVLSRPDFGPPVLPEPAKVCQP